MHLRVFVLSVMLALWVQEFSFGLTTAEKKDRENTGQLEALQEKARQYIKKNLDKALKYGNQSLELANIINDPVEIARTKDILGSIYLKRWNFPKALQNLKESSEISERIGLEDLLSSSYFKIGFASLEMGNYPQALEYYLKSLEISEKIGSKEIIGTLYNNIGIIYLHQNELTKALNYFFKTLEIDEKPHYRKMHAPAYNNIAIIYDKQGKKHLAENYYFKSLELAEELGDQTGVARIYTNLGELYFQQKNYPKARSFYLKVKPEDTEPAKSREFFAHRLLGLGKCQFATKKYNQAIKNVTLAFKTAQEINSLEISKESANLLSKVYETTGQYKLAYQMKLKYEESYEKIQKAIRIKKLTQLEQQYEYEKKQKILELEQKKKELEKEAEIRRQRSLLFIFLFAFLFASVFIIILVKLFMMKQAANRLLTVKQKEIKEQRDQLNELNSTKDKFFSIIAHDLKKPFSTLIGFLKLLLTEFDAYEKQKIKELLKTVQKSSEITYELLENLLLWANIQTGRIELKPDHMDLHQTADSVLTLFRLYANSKHIHLHNNIPKGTVVWADTKMIQLLLRNLISNALKFTTAGGTITIHSMMKDQTLEISVTDTGIGISPENTGKLFKIDQAFSTAGTANEKGTGLGLVLCKEFLNKVDGTIRVESRVGEGSTFTFSLPNP